jgi:hypothetical protein
MDFIVEKQTKEELEEIRSNKVELVKYNVRFLKQREKELQHELVKLNMKLILNATKLKITNLELEVLEMEGKGYDN